MAKKKTATQLGQEIGGKVERGELIDPVFPSFILLPINPDAIRILKHAIGLARIRGDAKAALGYAEKRKQFLNWIEDERGREAKNIVRTALGIDESVPVIINPPAEKVVLPAEGA